MAKQRYFRVLHKAGAFIDENFYGQDEIVPYTPTADEDKAGKPFWGQEVDEHGNEVGGKKNPDFISDKQADTFTEAQTGNKGAAAGNKGGKPAPVELTEDQKAQVKEAVALLEADNEGHWIKGVPAPSAVTNLVGFDVTAAQIKEIAPDVKRPKAA